MLKYIAPLLLVLISCNAKKSGSAGTTQRAYYFWQTSASAFDWQDSTYQSLYVKKVYTRFFDVDWDEGASAPVPVSPLTNYRYNALKGVSIVPVVFITNETFRKLDEGGTRALAHDVYKKITAILAAIVVDPYDRQNVYNAESQWEPDPYRLRTKDFREQDRYDSIFEAGMDSVKEIQFDCDWTAATKDKYFTFLQECNTLFRNKLVSSTVRLYQYRYPEKAGIPPVKRAVLMCYNAGNIKDRQTQNSIFDKDEVMSYLDAADKYPIPLDYALPTFEWAVLFQNGKFSSILSASDLRDNYSTDVALHDHNAVIHQDFVYGKSYPSLYIRKEDEIRLERADAADVRDIAKWLSKHRNNEQATLILYHLNDYDIQKHTKEIENIFDFFSF